MRPPRDIAQEARLATARLLLTAQELAGRDLGHLQVHTHVSVDSNGVLQVTILPKTKAGADMLRAAHEELEAA